MSIQTDLTRIKNAKAAIKAYIEGNGLTVPDATLLDGMALMLESIEAGGGAKYSYGSFTPSETTSLTTAYAIEHNSGFVPNIFIVTKSKSGTYVQYSIRFAASLPRSLFKGEAIDYNSYSCYVFGWGSANYDKAVGIVGIGNEITSTVAYIRSNAADNKVVAGETYLWFAIGGLE